MFHLTFTNTNFVFDKLTDYINTVVSTIRIQSRSSISEKIKFRKRLNINKRYKYTSHQHKFANV